MARATSLPEIQYFDIPNFKFQEGTRLPVARLAYLDINPTSNKVAVIITCFRGRLQSTLNFANGALRNHRVIVIALFGNGESSSPSNTPNFPVAGLSYADCVHAQHELLSARLQLTSVDIMVGFSMGGQCTYHWLLMYPDFVSAAAIICSSARTSRHNYQFLEGPKAALINSVDYVNGTTGNGSCFRGPLPERGLKAFGKAYSAWLTSAEWFDEELYEQLGFENLEAWNDVVAGTSYLTWHPDDLLAKLGMWQRGDITGLISSTPASLEDALGSIKARVLLMPCNTDQYFRWEASARECKSIPDAQLKVIPSVWGHIAGSGANEDDNTWMDIALADFLS
ncbi:Alpha/Beta hydrolase protein [Xylariaceae sp. FL1272]|nr:Alpha/Beta hydrolase protein [Xylariaceae sp. FL1272]